MKLMFICNSGYHFRSAQHTWYQAFLKCHQQQLVLHPFGISDHGIPRRIQLGPAKPIPKNRMRKAFVPTRSEDIKKTDNPMPGNVTEAF